MQGVFLFALPPPRSHVSPLGDGRGEWFGTVGKTFRQKECKRSGVYVRGVRYTAKCEPRAKRSEVEGGNEAMKPPPLIIYGATLSRTRNDDLIA